MLYTPDVSNWVDSPDRIYYLLYKWFKNLWYLKHGYLKFSSYIAPSTTFTWFMSKLDQFSVLPNNACSPSHRFYIGASINRGMAYCGISLPRFDFDTSRIFCTVVWYYPDFIIPCELVLRICSKMASSSVKYVVSTVQLTPATYRSPKWTVLYSVQLWKMTDSCFNLF
jgi:hypothetical protein